MTTKKHPPKLRQARDRKTCYACRSMDRRSGLCRRYQWPVERTQTCDTWKGGRS